MKSISIVELLLSLGVDAQPGFSWQPARCPFHHDSHASASYNEAEGLFVCHGCGVKGNAAQVVAATEQITLAEAELKVLHLGPPQEVPVPRRRRMSHVDGTLTAASHTYHDQLMERAEAAPARDYLAERCFGKADAWAARLGYVATPMPGHESYRGRLVVPYIASSGDVVDLRFRSVGPGEPKYLSLPGATSRLFDARLVLKAESVLAVCEGELDALTLSLLCGVPAVGVPGAAQWHKHWPKVLDGFDVVLVVGDGDEAGRRLTKRVVADVRNAVAVPLPEGRDCNSMVQSGDRGALLDLLKRHCPDPTLSACIGVG